MKNGIFVLVFLASALTRIFLLGSAPERLVKSLGQDLTCAVFSDQNYENENGNQYDLYIPAGLDKTQDQNLILYIHGGSFNSGSKADGETWCRYYAAQGYITASVDYTLQMHGKDASVYQMNKEIENAVRAIRQRTEELGYHIAGMAPFGVSAGGTLAMNLAYNGNSAIPVRFVFQVAAPTYFEPSEWTLLMKVDKLASEHDFCKMMTGKELEDYTQEIQKISPAGIVSDDSVPSLIAYGRIDHCVPVNQKKIISWKRTFFTTFHTTISNFRSPTMGCIMIRISCRNFWKNPWNMPSVILQLDPHELLRRNCVKLTRFLLQEYAVKTIGG